MIRFVFILPLLLLTACPSIRPETANERLVVLEHSYQAALKTVDSLIDAGRVNSARAADLESLIVEAGSAVRAARAAISSNAPDQYQALSVANSLLAQLINYLETEYKEEARWLIHYWYLKGCWQCSLSLKKPPDQLLRFKQYYRQPVLRGETLVMKRLQEYSL